MACAVTRFGWFAILCVVVLEDRIRCCVDRHGDTIVISREVEMQFLVIISVLLGEAETNSL